MIKNIRIQNDNSSYWYTLFFLPIFLTPSGLYQNYVTETGLHLGDSGLVFPIYFFVGLLLLMFLVILSLFNGKISFISLEVKLYAGIIMVMGFFIASAGVIINSNLTVYVRFFQLLTGFVGLIISWFLFEYKKINILNFFGKLGELYFIVIILNYIYSFSMVGLSSFGRGLLPSIGVINIYQTHVYYPFIVTTICFMGLPYILNKYKSGSLIYLGMYLIYLLSWQVRGAIISYTLMLTVAILIKFSIKMKVFALFFLLVFLSFLIKFFGTDLILGRFANIESVTSFSGRTEIWSSVFNEYDFSKLLVGNMFFDGDGVTAHNQYLQLLDQGGILILIPFLILFLNIILVVLNVVKSKGNKNNILYFFFILLVQWIVDFNVNVPINNTNPAIFYWFYINAFFVLIYLSYKKEGKK